MTLLALLVENGTPIVKADGEPAADFAALLGIAPELREPAHAQDAARALNHFAQGYDFKVIQDPDAFRADYEARYATSPPGPFIDARPRLTDFAKPDLNEVAAPAADGDSLVFYALDDFAGLPFRVRSQGYAPVTKADYRPVKPA